MVRGESVWKFIRQSVLVTGLWTPTSEWRIQKRELERVRCDCLILTEILAADGSQHLPEVQARRERHVRQDELILLRLALVIVRNAQVETIWRDLHALALVALDEAQDTPRVGVVVQLLECLVLARLLLVSLLVISRRL